MGIHFYLGGTAGGKDGTLISDGDMTAPLLFDGFYPAAGTTLTKTKTIHIRADEGEIWHFVFVSLRGNTKAKYDIYCTNNQLWLDNYIKCIMIATLQDNNIPILVKAAASGNDEGSPDISCKLNAWGEQV